MSFVYQFSTRAERHFRCRELFILSDRPDRSNSSISLRKWTRRSTQFTFLVRLALSGRIANIFYCALFGQADRSRRRTAQKPDFVTRNTLGMRRRALV